MVEEPVVPNRLGWCGSENTANAHDAARTAARTMIRMTAPSNATITIANWRKKKLHAPHFAVDMVTILQQ